MWYFPEREITSGGLDYLVEVMEEKGEYTRFGKVLPVTVQDLSFIIASEKGLIGTKEYRIIILRNGKNGTILYLRIRG